MIHKECSLQLAQSLQTCPLTVHIALLLFQVPCKPHFCSLLMSDKTSWFDFRKFKKNMQNEKPEKVVKEINCKVETSPWNFQGLMYSPAYQLSLDHKTQGSDIWN